MRRIHGVLGALVVALSSVVLSSAPVSATPPPQKTLYYLSLGDSLAQGVQPDPATGDNTITNRGYADRLWLTLKAKNPALQLIKLGCPGESTTTMREGGGPCAVRYDSGRQLKDATDFITAHPAQIAYLTVDIGPNDVLGCISPDNGIDHRCFDTGVRTVQANLDNILGSLKQALVQSDNRRTLKAGMTFYDPALANWYTNQDLAKVSVVSLTYLNLTEAAKYLQYGFRVAPVASAFKTYDFSIPAGQSEPVNVRQLCVLTFACEGNIHAKDGGYQLIADTFAKTFRW